MERFELPKDELSRDRQSEKLVLFMDKLHAGEIFSTSESKQEFIESLTFEQFQRFIDTVNGLLRDIPLNERGADGNSVALMAKDGSMAKAFNFDEPHYPPRHQDKEVLSQEMFCLVKKLAQEGDLETAALLTAAGVNAIHQYMDGNGRTSRLIYFLLTENYTGSEEQVEKLKKVLGEEGRLYININPGPVDRQIKEYIAFNKLGIHPEDDKYPRYLNSFGGTKLDERVFEDVKLNFKRHIIGDASGYGFFAVYKFLEDNNKLERAVTQFKEGDEIVRTDLRIVDMVKELEPEDYEKILEIYWQFKKEGCSLLLNAIAKPEDYLLAPPRSMNKDEREEKTIKEALLKSIDGGYKRSFEEVNAQDISAIWNEREALSFSEQLLSVEDLNQLRDINRSLKGITEEEKRERESLQFDMEKAEEEFNEQRQRLSQTDLQKRGEVEGLSDEAEREIFELKQRIYKPILDISRKYLDKVTDYLDSLDIWKSKFTTRNSIRHLTETQQEHTDSIYYITQGGQSLRLKKYELLMEGLGSVIQPFTEKIFFIKNEDEASDDPEVGSNVVEYYTKEFISIQKEDGVQGEFKSKIRRYEKDGTIVYLNPVDSLMHKGYGVNKILK